MQDLQWDTPPNMMHLVHQLQAFQSAPELLRPQLAVPNPRSAFTTTPSYSSQSGGYDPSVLKPGATTWRQPFSSVPGPIPGNALLNVPLGYNDARFNSFSKLQLLLQAQAAHAAAATTSSSPTSSVTATEDVSMSQQQAPQVMAKDHLLESAQLALLLQQLQQTQQMQPLLSQAGLPGSEVMLGRELGAQPVLLHQLASLQHQQASLLERSWSASKKEGFEPGESEVGQSHGDRIGAMPNSNAFYSLSASLGRSSADVHASNRRALVGIKRRTTKTARPVRSKGDVKGFANKPSTPTPKKELKCTGNITRWIKGLLKETFFLRCPHHDEPKNDITYYHMSQNKSMCKHCLRDEGCQPNDPDILQVLTTCLLCDSRCDTNTLNANSR